MEDHNINYCYPMGSTDFAWSNSSQGFGSIAFYIKDGIPYISNELIGRQQIKDMLCKMVDNCILDCPSDRDGDGTPEQDRKLSK